MIIAGSLGAAYLEHVSWVENRILIAQGGLHLLDFAAAVVGQCLVARDVGPVVIRISVVVAKALAPCKVRILSQH